MMLRAALAAIFILTFTPPLLAHKVTTVSGGVFIDTKEKTFEVNLMMDVESSGDAELDDQIPPDQAARDFATEALTVFFDDQEIENPKVESKLVDHSDEDTPEELRRIKAHVLVTGSIPEGAENFMLYVSDETEISVVMVFIKDGKQSRRPQVLLPGSFSRPQNVLPFLDKDPFTEADSQPDEKTDEPETQETQPNSFVAGWNAIFGERLIHWVFAVSLLFFSLKLGFVVPQFLTFLLSVLGGIGIGIVAEGDFSLNPMIVVGLGMAAIGIANLFKKIRQQWRLLIILPVGFFHGLLLRNDVVISKTSGWVGFNLGIVAALLAAYLAAFFLLALLKKRQPNFENVISLPMNALFCGLGFYWAFFG